MFASTASCVVALALAAGGGLGRVDLRVSPASVAPFRVAQEQATGAAAPSGTELHVDLARDGAIAAGTIALAALGSHYAEDLAPSSCRWCEPNRFDTWARDQLLWSDPGAARAASNVGIVAVPAGMAAALALSSGFGGPHQRMAEDFVVLAEAFGITMLGDEVVKLTAARLRPYAYAGAPTGTVDDRLSFWSGHSALAFSAATGAGTIAKLRGYSQWPWILGVGLAGATATAWFRVAGDRHWMTDVLAGAAWGSAVGVAVPLLHSRTSSGVTAVPAGRSLVLVMSL